MDAWCAFLGRLATDAEAALAAAMAYRELDDAARDVWIAALDQDIGRVAAPRIAVYAPLLAVETDPDRRSRVVRAIGPVDPAAAPRALAHALSGVAPGGLRIAALIVPLYLDFVQVLACAYRSGGGFEWVKHDPIVSREQAPSPGAELGGARVEATPLPAVIDDLAAAIVAQVRTGRPLPEALRVFADLFGPTPEGA
ncbi:MAG: hypothetical protein FJ104_15415, partial [Deltaproteobacteria bacterium]|nr:hypothetical protein [Deltaproteobacteria bacterium]